MATIVGSGDYRYEVVENSPIAAEEDIRCMQKLVKLV